MGVKDELLVAAPQSGWSAFENGGTSILCYKGIENDRNFENEIESLNPS